VKKRRRAIPETAGGSASYTCPSCSQSVDTCPDPGGGEQQTYVEDCPLCCRPNVLRVAWDADLAGYVIEATRE
jgi:hypothetical protein